MNIDQLLPESITDDLSNVSKAKAVEIAFYSWFHKNNTDKTIAQLFNENKLEYRSINGKHCYCVNARDIGLGYEYSDLTIGVAYPTTSATGQMITAYEHEKDAIEYIILLMVREDPLNMVDVSHKFKHGTFVHEFTHYLDRKRKSMIKLTTKRAKAALSNYEHGKFPKSNSEGQSLEQYFNSPSEYNAFYSEGITGALQQFLFDSEAGTDVMTEWLSAFKPFSFKCYKHFTKQFLRSLTPDNVKRLKKRLYGLYMFLKGDDLVQLKKNFRITESVSEEVSEYISDENWKEAFDSAEGAEEILAVLSACDAKKIVFKSAPDVAPIFVTDDHVIEWDGSEKYASVTRKDEWIYNVDPETYYPNYEDNYNKIFWEHPDSLYHETTSKSAKIIHKDGLKCRNETRGLTNRGVSHAIFTTRDYEMCDGSYGDVPFEIDTRSMLRDGYTPYVSQEPDVVETALRGFLAAQIGMENFDGEAENGMHESTVIIYGDIPTKYLRTDAEILESVSKRDGFMDWFTGSKVVDKDGLPVKLYRGMYGEHVASDPKVVKPRDGYAMFFSNSPHVSASYSGPSSWAGEDSNAIFPVYVKATVLHEYPVKNGKLDMFAFDTIACRLIAGHGVVARGVYDIGPKANNKIDPDMLYSYRSDIYAFGKGTSMKSAISNTGAFDETKPEINEAVGDVSNLYQRYKYYNQKLFNGELPVFQSRITS